MFPTGRDGRSLNQKNLQASTYPHSEEEGGRTGDEDSEEDVQAARTVWHCRPDSGGRVRLAYLCEERGARGGRAGSGGGVQEEKRSILSELERQSHSP
jgi:hypothetical protein